MTLATYQQVKHTTKLTNTVKAHNLCHPRNTAIHQQFRTTTLKLAWTETEQCYTCFYTVVRLIPEQRQLCTGTSREMGGSSMCGANKTYPHNMRAVTVSLNCRSLCGRCRWKKRVHGKKSLLWSFGTGINTHSFAPGQHLV